MLAHISPRKRNFYFSGSFFFLIFFSGTLSGQFLTNPHIGSSSTISDSESISIAQIGLITGVSGEGMISILDVSELLVEEEPLAIKESISLQFYPNPTRDALHIETDLSNYDIRISDVQGRILHESTNLGSRSVHDFKSYAPGMYLIYVMHQNRTFKTLRIVKQ